LYLIFPFSAFLPLILAAFCSFPTADAQILLKLPVSHSQKTTVSVSGSFLNLYKKSIFGLVTKLNHIATNNNDSDGGNNKKNSSKPLNYNCSLPN